MREFGPDWITFVLAIVSCTFALWGIRRGVTVDGMMRAIRRSEQPHYFMLMIAGYVVFSLIMLSLFVSSL